jgi:hypothetical protein
MPNNWKNINRLNITNENDFIEKNHALLGKIAKEADWMAFASDGFTIRDVIYNNTTVYKEEIGSYVFYRLVTGKQKEQDYNNQWETKFLQSLVIEKNGKIILLAMATYNEVTIGQRFDTTVYGCINIIQKDNIPLGIIIAHVEPGIDGYNKRFTSIDKGQISGGVRILYFPWNEMMTVDENSEFGWYDEAFFPQEIFANLNKIYGSSCLLDPNNPLRYGLQNIFDSDPATSYVENTEDDLIKIDLTYMSLEGVNEIAIINGYAQSRNLYEKNNRVKAIVVKALEWNEEHTFLEYKGTKKIELLDTVLSYQFIAVARLHSIDIVEIYSGVTYNDTCIAELNFKTEKGWIFEGIE